MNGLAFSNEVHRSLRALGAEVVADGFGDATKVFPDGLAKPFLMIETGDSMYYTVSVGSASLTINTHTAYPPSIASAILTLAA